MTLTSEPRSLQHESYLANRYMILLLGLDNAVAFARRYRELCHRYPTLLAP